MSTQRWADGMNMWPNAVGTFNRPSASVYVYKQFVWVFQLYHRNVDKKYLKKSKNFEKNRIMIWGIHYFITKKRKLMSSQGATLNITDIM